MKKIAFFITVGILFSYIINGCKKSEEPIPTMPPSTNAPAAPK